MSPRRQPWGGAKALNSLPDRVTLEITGLLILSGLRWRIYSARLTLPSAISPRPRWGCVSTTSALRGVTGPNVFKELSMTRLILPTMSPNPTNPPSAFPSGENIQTPWSCFLCFINGRRNRASRVFGSNTFW